MNVGPWGREVGPLLAPSSLGWDLAAAQAVSSFTCHHCRLKPSGTALMKVGQPPPSKVPFALLTAFSSQRWGKTPPLPVLSWLPWGRWESDLSHSPLSLPAQWSWTDSSLILPGPQSTPQNWVRAHPRTQTRLGKQTPPLLTTSETLTIAFFLHIWILYSQYIFYKDFMISDWKD